MPAQNREHANERQVGICQRPCRRHASQRPRTTRPQLRPSYAAGSRARSHPATNSSAGGLFLPTPVTLSPRYGRVRVSRVASFLCHHGILSLVKTIDRKKLLPVLGIAVLCVAAAGIWLGVGAWRSNVRSSAVPAAGELVFQGALLHNWNGPISDNCDFRFQLWDADINGTPAGDVVEVDDVGVRDSAFDLAVPAARLGEAGLASWLAVAVRCSEGEWETLAPRMQHQALALAGAAAAGWDLPAAAALVCSVPAADAAASEHGPVIAGVQYRLEGGFRAAVAGGAR